jgi:pimeloyl-ACP methyl ester carboxylesterase
MQQHTAMSHDRSNERGLITKRWVRSFAIAGITACLLGSVALAAQVPPEISTDPVSDKDFPASSVVLHVPSHGVVVNGLAYLPAGAGPHPVPVLLHGLPGNEKNLDLAQAVRRTGWIAVTFNYRGSCGSPGTFSFEGNLEDTEAIPAYLNGPKTAKSLRLDPRRIVLGGPSMGGAVTAAVAARTHDLRGAVLISAWDVARAVSGPHEQLVAFMSGDMGSLSGVTPESIASDLEAHADEFSFKALADGLVDTPLLVLTSNDHNQDGDDALVLAIRSKGGHRVTKMHVATDHVWSDRRIELEADVITLAQAIA